MKKTKIIFAVLASLFLGACSSSDNSDNRASRLDGAGLSVNLRKLDRHEGADRKDTGAVHL